MHIEKMNRGCQRREIKLPATVLARTNTCHKSRMDYYPPGTFVGHYREHRYLIKAASQRLIRIGNSHYLTYRTVDLPHGNSLGDGVVSNYSLKCTLVLII